MTGVTNGAGTTLHSGAPEFTPCFSGVHVARSLVFCVVFCRSFFFCCFCPFSFGHCVCPSSIYGSLLRSPLPFGIFKLFVESWKVDPCQWHVSIYIYIYISRRGKNKNLTALKSNSNTVWFNFQTYIYIYIYIQRLKNQSTINLTGCWIVTV